MGVESKRRCWNFVLNFGKRFRAPQQPRAVYVSHASVAIACSFQVALEEHVTGLGLVHNVLCGSSTSSQTGSTLESDVRSALHIQAGESI
jgi:hypothetical protein